MVQINLTYDVCIALFHFNAILLKKKTILTLKCLRISLVWVISMQFYNDSEIKVQCRFWLVSNIKKTYYYNLVLSIDLPLIHCRWNQIKPKWEKFLPGTSKLQSSFPLVNGIEMEQSYAHIISLVNLNDSLQNIGWERLRIPQTRFYLKKGDLPFLFIYTHKH